MKTSEELLIKILNYLAGKFKNQLVLKGGMLLRIMDSPRTTQDLDFWWKRTKKRTLFAEDLKDILEKLPEVSVKRLQVNSRNIVIDLVDRDKKEAKIEITVSRKPLHLKPVPRSTATIAGRYKIESAAIATMDLSEAFAHKIAASLERNLARDLYDLLQFEHLTLFDQGTLFDRLSRLEIDREKPRKVTIKEAIEILKNKSDSLTDEKVRVELGSALPKDYLLGLSDVIRSAVGRIIQRLEVLTPQ